MIHTVIVPGVGGSEYQHWQSWLERQLLSCSRVEQSDWNHPVLSEWVAAFIRTLKSVNPEQDIQIVAHSFGCLTTVAALAEYPELHSRIKNVVLVAPANPARFGEAGFARNSNTDYQHYFHALQLQVPTTLIISENDPWLNFPDAQALAAAWKLKPVNIGAAGHINVASGFGPFPALHDYLISENMLQHINITDDHKYLFRFAI